MITHFLSQVGDGDINIPDDAGSGVVWVLFVAVLAGLWWIVSRTRRRSEQEFWQRQQDEKKRRDELP